MSPELQHKSKRELFTFFRFLLPMFSAGNHWGSEVQDSTPSPAKEELEGPGSCCALPLQTVITLPAYYFLSKGHVIELRAEAWLGRAREPPGQDSL
jgi:hypothetical protein